MKKSAFKFMTYVGIFLILPILRLFGSRFYEKNVVPKLIDFLCGTKPIQYQRKKDKKQLLTSIAFLKEEY